MQYKTVSQYHKPVYIYIYYIIQYDNPKYIA